MSASEMMCDQDIVGRKRGEMGDRLVMGVYERRACGIYCRGGSGRSGRTARIWSISADVCQETLEVKVGEPDSWVEHVVSQAGKTVLAIKPAFRLGVISTYGSHYYSLHPIASLILQIVWPKLQIHPQVHPPSSLVLNLQSGVYQVAWAPSHPPRPLLSHCPAPLLFPSSRRPLVDHVSVDSNMKGRELS